MSTTHSLPLSLPRDVDRFTEQRKTPTSDTVEITRHFMRYVQTFQALNPQAMLRHVRVPLVFLDGREMHVLSSSAEIEALLTNIMRDLVSRGYARSDLEELWVYPLSPSTALVSVARARYNANGDEIDCLGETYTLLRDGDDEWRIAIAVVHDDANVLRARRRCRRD
jgi:hypothetical protein